MRSFLKKVISVWMLVMNVILVGTNAKNIKLIPGDSEYEKYMDSEDLKEIKNVQRSWIYSAILPGWGQIYNEKPIRAAVIWGSILFFVGGAYYTHNEYIKNEHSNIKESYVGNYKKVRDAFLLTTVIIYLLNIFDAYTVANLSSYSVSKNVAVEVVPVASHDSGVGLGFKINLF